MVLLGAGAGLPRADDAVDVGRVAERRRAGLRPRQHDRCRWAARSAWPCWRRSRRRRPAACASGESALAALNGGYHLACLIGADLIVAAIAVAVAVLQPERKAAARAVRSARLLGRDVDMFENTEAFSGFAVDDLEAARAFYPDRSAFGHR